MLWRIHKGLTQAQLAELVGISRPNLSRIERDNHDVSLKTIRAIAGSLGLTPGILVDGRLPGQGARTPKRLSRSNLERIALNAVAGRKLPNPREEEIAENLRFVIAPRLRAMSGESKWRVKIGAKANRAWLKLCQLPVEERDSLIQRAIEHAATTK